MTIKKNYNNSFLHHLIQNMPFQLLKYLLNTPCTYWHIRQKQVGLQPFHLTLFILITCPVIIPILLGHFGKKLPYFKNIYIVCVKFDFLH